MYSIGKKEAGTCPVKITTMAGDSSIASELIKAINLPNLKPIPSYLSEGDAMTVREYLQTEYACEYSIDTSNVYWGGEPNSNHVYNMFSEFRSHHDSVKMRMEMLKFVIDNERRYDWNGHLFLRMNNLTLATWIQQQTHFGNSADGLAIYALSDMCGVHATIVTKTKPWTTIHPTYSGDVYEALCICKVNMVYLGYNKFARLRKKANPVDPSYITQSYNLPSMVALPAPPTREELETAETLLQLQGTKDECDQDPSPSNLSVPPAVIFVDAMDKVCGQYDATAGNTSKIHDAFDKILLSSDDSEDELHVETDIMIPYLEEHNELPGDTDMIINTKPCCVSVTRLESILLDDPPKDASELPVGEHYTRSHSTPRKERTGRKPRKANTGVKYQYIDDTFDTPSQKTEKPVPSRTGPTASRIRSQSSTTEDPLQRLPPVPSLTSPDEDEEDNLPLVEIQRELRAETPKTTKKRGVFKTKEHGIKKKEVQNRKYRCKICGASVEGARALTKHHQKEHGILYCDHCQKAFNNQRSLAKHLYTHKTLNYKCNKCGKAFPFKSQLTTHRISHHKPTHKCMHGKCDRTFKNIGDLNRHVCTHTAKWIVCPDCPNYKTKDKRNFESHRQCHNQIEKYWCSTCGEGFIHSTQKSRHEAQKNCKKA